MHEGPELNTRKREPFLRAKCLLLKPLCGRSKNVLFFFYIHFEITGDPCNLTGSQQSNLFTNHIIFFALNHISFLNHITSVSHTKWDVKASDYFFQKTGYCINKILVLSEFRHFKMAVLKWQLNFVSSTFGLKAYFWVQIQLGVRAHPILKSRVYTRPHCTLFRSLNYHY